MLKDNENTVSSETTNKVVIKRDFAPHRRVSYRICKECGKMWVLTDNESMYFIKKYGSLPLRCNDCRERNREKTSEVATSEDSIN